MAAEPFVLWGVSITVSIAAAEVERFLTDAIKKYGRRGTYGDKRKRH